MSLSNEIADAAPRSSSGSDDADLENQKLSLEVEMLSSELGHLKAEKELGLQKLDLEVKQLRRSEWRKPGTIIPIAATVLAIAFATMQGAFNVAIQKVQLGSDLADFKTQKLEQRNVELAKALTQLDQRRDEINRDVSQLLVQQRELEAQRATLKAQGDLLLQDLTQLRSDRSALASEIGRTQSQLKEAEARANSAYPAFRDATVQAFIFEARRQCVDARLPVSSLSLLSDQKAVEAPESAEQAFPDTAQCLSKLLGTSQDVKKLNPADLDKLTLGSKKLTERISDLRAEAMRAYSAASHISETKVYADINRGPDPFINRAPTSEPERSNWLEALRRVRILEAYNRVTESPTRGLQNFWADQPRGLK